jgi:CRP/FNR family transcriptional regulator
VGEGGTCRFVDRHHRRGALLYLQGDQADHIYFVKRGTVVLTRSGGISGGGDGAHGIRRTQSFIGVEALVTSTYLDSARALDDVIVCGAHVNDLDAWLGPPESPARVLLRGVLLSLTNEAPRGAGRDGVTLVRVARWLLDGGAQTRTIPRHVIADLLGMAPETLSRALARLAERGAIEVSRSSIRPIDLDILRQAARL